MVQHLTRLLIGGHDTGPLQSTHNLLNTPYGLAGSNLLSRLLQISVGTFPLRSLLLRESSAMNWR